jgi:hypothetical protein
MAYVYFLNLRGEAWRSFCISSVELSDVVAIDSLFPSTDVLFRKTICRFWPIPVATRSKTWVCCSSLAGIVGSNPARGMDVCLCIVECCLLSGRGLCVALVTRPEGSYRVWCVSECDREASLMRGP